MKKYKIAILGGGNVAHHLIRQVTGSGHKLVQIYNRTLSTAKDSATESNASPIDNLQSLTQDADIYIICVKDEAIASLASKIKLKDKLIVHTSGTSSMDLLRDSSNQFGIFYPLQSFSKNLAIDFRRIPILIETNEEKGMEALKTFANSISDTVVEMKESERVHIHIAGVFVNNFVNHLFSLSDEYLSKNNMDFNLLKPLILQTVEKLNFGKPAEMQTGPAKRNDLKTIESHLKVLESEKNLHEIYDVMTKSILKSLAK